VLRNMKSVGKKSDCIISFTGNFYANGFTKACSETLKDHVKLYHISVYDH